MGLLRVVLASPVSDKDLILVFIKMVIDKKFKGLVKEDFRYVFYGNIETTEDLEIDLDMGLFVTGSIEAGWYIKADESIDAGESIKAGGYIEAGGSSGIVAGLSITCKGTLSFGLKAFAGICSWREISEEEKTITCEKFNGGVVEYGILKETGLEEDRKIELSMDEIAQKFGVAVKDLKIKKD